MILNLLRPPKRTLLQHFTPTVQFFEIIFDAVVRYAKSRAATNLPSSFVNIAEAAYTEQHAAMVQYKTACMFAGIEFKVI